MTTNTLSISAADNELIAVAFQDDVSYELCRISSGNYNPVSVKITIEPGQNDGPIVLNGVNGPLKKNCQTNLPSGNYVLALVGINWGGPAQFDAALNGILFKGSTGKGIGVVWAPDLQKFSV